MSYNFMSGSVSMQGSFTANGDIRAKSSALSGSELNVGSANLSATELEILDGALLSTAELNLLNDVTRGSILYGNASGASALLGKGTAHQFLQSDGTDISYVAMSGDATLNAGAITIANNAVSLAKMAGITRGSIILGDSSGDPSLLAKGSAAQFLQSDGTDPSYVTISGDATIAAGGALTIAAGAVENSMLADDAVGADELAANAVVEASIVDNAVSLAKMAGLARGKFIIGDASGDPSALALGSAHQFFQSDGTDAAWVSMSGDVTLAAGVATIGAATVHHAMLNDDIISGKDELAHANIADADELMVSDGGVIKRVGIDSLQNHYFAAISGDATVADGGALTIAADAVEPSMMNIFDDSLAATDTHIMIADGTDYSSFAVSGDATLSNAGVLTIAANAIQTGMVHDDVATELAGNGLVAASGVLAIQVSGAVKIASDKVGISGSFAGKGLQYDGGVNSISSLKVNADPNSFNVGSDGLTLASTVAGNGLALALGILSVGVDNTGIELNSDALRLKDLGVATAKLANDAVTPAKMSIFDDSLAATTTHFMIADGTDYSSFALSGDVSCTNAGVVTIAAASVEHGMLAEDIISGQAELAHADIADADELMISDGGAIKRVGLDSLQNHYFAAISGDATVADGGALTIAANAVEGSMINANAAGGGLSYSSNALQLELSELSAESAIASGDTFAFVQEGEVGDPSKKVTIDNLATKLAGPGITATAGVLRVEKVDVNAKADGDALVEGFNYFADLASDAAVTLPAGPSVGDVVYAKAKNLTGAKITISRAGSHVIDGGQTSIKIEVPYGAISFVYVNTNDWRIF